jgi:DNA-binding NarL/FixJ family response regulator
LVHPSTGAIVACPVLTMRRASLLLADDHTILIEGLVGLLKDRFEVVGTVSDGQALVDAALHLRPDVIVADLAMPGMSGLDAMEQIKKHGVDSRFVILTMHSEAVIAAKAMRAGASAFVLKHAAGDELVNAIFEVLQGRMYLAPAVTKEVLEILQSPAGRPGVELTPRQRDVLRLIVEGRRMKEIASILDLSTRTVETHKYEIMRTLGAQSTADLIRYALENGLV